MQKILLVVYLVALCFPLTRAGNPPADADSPGQSEVRDLETNLAKLLEKGEWDRYGSYLAEDYVRTDERGRLQDKAAVLAELRSRKGTFLNVTPEDLAVRSYGDTAVLTGHLTLVNRENGKVTTTFLRYTQVFVKHAEQWLLVATQDTRVND